MMYEFDDWLHDLYKDKGIIKSEVEDALKDDGEKIRLWQEYISDFSWPERIDLVKEALEKLLLLMEKNDEKSNA